MSEEKEEEEFGWPLYSGRTVYRGSPVLKGYKYPREGFTFYPRGNREGNNVYTEK